MTQATAGEFVEFHDGNDLPPSIVLEPGQAARVTRFDLAEQLVARGVDSARIAVDLHNQLDAWARDVPLAPPQPFNFDKRIVIVLPTYNERDNLPLIVAAIARYLVCDVLIVDDNSPDGTGALADELAATHNHIHVMHRAGKMGLASAYLDGFDWALKRDYELVFEMDSDFSHPPHDLPRLAHAATQADLALGSRYVKGGGAPDWSFGRWLLSDVGNLYARLWLGMNVHDWTGGFRCYRADLLRAMDLSRVRSVSYSVQIELTWLATRCGARIREVPFRFAERAHGESKIAGATVLEAIHRVPRLRMGQWFGKKPRRRE